MFRSLFLLTLLPLAGWLVGGKPAMAQVVSLPTQQQFSYRGSVLVPDGGSTYLGGVRRAASGSARRGFGGVPFSSSRGSTLSHSGLSISATIIDHQEIDRQLLGGTPQEFMEAVARERRQSAEQQAAEARSLERGKALVRYARRLAAAGKIEGSRSAYRLAMPLLNEQLRPLAMAEYQRLP
ncbi:hypothetical protein [Roseimaritima ulvae]|uniref:Uncharacterized protein n=1 Tax=Roseimaritima ulvae TaxID=980254 RepID=A0A5B9QY03_9BACT|nr:hypothetical protein [Roseimaritima ulvae]QEG42700.1 hypothetical protein UC8_47420 [Roseimaritima ulvae]